VIEQITCYGAATALDSISFARESKKVSQRPLLSPIFA